MEDTNFRPGMVIRPTQGATVLIDGSAARYFLTTDSLHLDAIERVAIREALAITEGNRSKAALLLGINVRTLRRKLNGTKRKAPTVDARQGELLGAA